MTRPEPTVRERLLDGALRFIESIVDITGVQRIAFLGSIVSPKPNPKDVDLLVYVAGDADLAPLAESARRLRGRLQSHNLGADVFLADDRKRYLGRACSWKDCRPGIRASCDAAHCGRRPYLHDDLLTVQLPKPLVAAPPLEVWPVIVRRCSIPVDLERVVAQVSERHNNALNRALGGARRLHGEET